MTVMGRGAGHADRVTSLPGGSVLLRISLAWPSTDDVEACHSLQLSSVVPLASADPRGNGIDRDAATAW